MASYNAGESVGTYTLRAEQAIKQQLELIKNYQALAKAAGFKPPAVSAGGGASSVNAAALAQQRLATETQKTATASNQAARAAQGLATEQNKTAREAANTAAAQDRAAKSALQLAAAQQRAAKASQNGGNGPALPRTFAGFTPQGLNQAAGAFGLATLGPQIVGQTISAGIEAGKAAVALDRTLRLTKELTGTQAQYNQVIAAAKTQQELYGGSLNENIAGIQGLVVTARSTGAELNTLINLAQRLAVLDPAQGAEGARIALSEVLSGDPRSLARRYEIPLSALQKIKDESVPVADRLLILDQYLNKIGITSATVTSVVTDQARAFNKLGAELGTLQTNAGQGLANFFERSATGLSRLVGLVNSNPQALAELKKLRIFGGDGSGVNEADLDAATRQIAQEKAGTQLDPTRGQRGKPTAIIERIGGAEAFHEVREQLTELNVAGGVAADQADILAQSFRAGTISADTYRNGLSALLADVNAGGDAEDRRALAMKGAQSATDAAAEAAQKHATALIDATTKSQAAAVESGKLADFQATLAGLGDAVAGGLQTSGNAALSLASLYGIAVDKARALIDAQATLAGKDAGVTEGRSERDTPTSLAQGRTAGLQGVRERAAALELARTNQLLKTGTAAQVVTQRQKEYNDAVKQFGKDSAEAVNAQTNLIDAQQAAAKPKRGPKDPNAVGLGVLDQDSIQAGEDAQAQLDAVNKLLERTNLTEHQRNDLLEKRRKLEQDITEEGQKQARASIDARLGANEDAQKRLKEVDVVAGLRRAIDAGRLTGKQRTAAELRIEEIGLEQQKRALDIQKDAKAAGVAIGPAPGAQAGAGATPGITPQVPIPNLATLPPVVPSSVVVNISLAVDKSGNVTASAPDPSVVLNILGNAVTFRNLSGGA